MFVKKLIVESTPHRMLKYETYFQLISELIKINIHFSQHKGLHFNMLMQDNTIKYMSKITAFSLTAICTRHQHSLCYPVLPNVTKHLHKVHRLVYFQLLHKT